LQGCSSWKWYFPYHYAPFASDFINIGDIKNEFEKGTRPFKPLEQLMSVFPAASRQHVPDPWGELMIGGTRELMKVTNFFIDVFFVFF
jgi:5'-3' exoribonuclease 2